MKLRIRGNSIRLRLLKSEVATLAEKGRITETIIFGPSENETLTYAVQVSEAAETISAGFCENEICVILPKPTALKWTESEQIGIEASISIGDNNLGLLVEKDFVCLTRTDDPDSDDAYPNPEEKC